MKLNKTESGVSVELTVSEFVELMNLEDRRGVLTGEMIAWARTNMKKEVSECIAEEWDGCGPLWWRDDS